VVLVLLALLLAPVTDAVTHGPGTLVAQADHAAWHAERGELWQSDGHQHHDVEDHDHAVSAILTSQNTYALEFNDVIELRDLPVFTMAIRDGPRRPPRGIFLMA
jgi:hypothetical protein